MYNNFKIVACTAAGRRRYMQYLVPYVLESKTLDRYDIWVNTHNGADIEFFNQLKSLSPKINVIMQPEGWVKGNASINIFYKDCCQEDTIYFKLDDDIVWMEGGAIDKMVKFRVDNPEPFIVTPLVINNALSTYLLQVCNKLKLSSYRQSKTDDVVLWKSDDFALQLHEWFLSKLRNNDIRNLHVGRHYMGMCRFSINAIMWFGRDMRKFGGIVPGDDEEFLSCIYPSKIGAANCWNGDIIMAHFAFFTQREKLDEANILEQYGEIVEKEWKNQNSIYGGRMKEIMKFISTNEKELMSRPSPFKDYNIHLKKRTQSTTQNQLKHFVVVQLRKVINPLYHWINPLALPKVHIEK